MRLSRRCAALLPVTLAMLVPALAGAAPHDPKDLEVGKVARRSRARTSRARTSS